MKKLLLLMMVLAGTTTIQADDTYAYLVFETTDGATISVPVSTMTLTISGTTLTVGSQSFTLTNLNKMYFSNTGESTGFEEVTRAAIDEATEIYDMQGHQVTKEQMRKGVYIVKTPNRTYKMIVK